VKKKLCSFARNNFYPTLFATLLWALFTCNLYKRYANDVVALWATEEMLMFFPVPSNQEKGWVAQGQ